jgi:hypothetical protein
MPERHETLLFLHIPKAAGTTLGRIVERHVPASRQYRLGANAQKAIETFNDWPAERRARYRLISGHFPYGVHEQVPGPHAYFTMLREPLDRVASFHAFVLRDPGHYLTQAMPPEQRASLARFARETQATTVDNGQTRLLAGDWGHVPFGGCTPDMLERAKANLRRMAVVGLTERFDESLLLLGQRFGWRHLGYRRQNETQGRERGKPMDEETREALAALNVYDLTLYAYAQGLFEEAWQTSGLRADEFAERHPPPSPLQEKLWRLKSRTPHEWLRSAIGKR